MGRERRHYLSWREANPGLLAKVVFGFGVCIVSYWSIVLPLTLLTAYLEAAKESREAACGWCWLSRRQRKQKATQDSPHIPATRR